jgi:hypothetical protein
MRAIARDPGDRYASAEAFGVALAEAATQSFGSGWLGRADLTLVATGPIAIAAGPATATTDDGVTSVAGDATTVTGRETMIAGKGAPIPQDPPLRMRATAVHRAGVRIDELRPEDLVRVDDLMKPPKPPRLALAITAVLLALLVVVSVLGIGTAEYAPPTLRGQTVLPPGGPSPAPRVGASRGGAVCDKPCSHRPADRPLPSPIRCGVQSNPREMMSARSSWAIFAGPSRPRWRTRTPLGNVNRLSQFTAHS